MLLHGTAIAIAGRAVLIRGPSGSGKSDLALRCLAVQPGLFAASSPLLVADDQVVVEARDGHVQVSAPERIRGLIEVRGVGIVEVPSVECAMLALVAEIVGQVEVERMPEAALTCDICGVRVPCMTISAWPASAPLKLLMALAGKLQKCTMCAKQRARM